jgi:steroid 5-alpha reductase family enzyme
MWAAIADFAVVSSCCGAALLALHAVTFAIARRIGRYNVVDVAWGLGFIVVTAFAAMLGRGDASRRWLLLALVAVWGLRLSAYLYRRSAGHGEDRRYADLLRGATVGQIVRKVFLLQAFATWFISLPLQLSAVTGPTPRRWLAATVAGIALWAIGVVFEAVGDHQLRVFKSDPAHRGLVMDRGLWAWTRHPNYFGDACVWWGLWLITITAWWTLPTAASPLLMTYFLVRVSGGQLTEKYMAGRPGFDEYTARTSFFVPRPPRWPPRSANSDDRRR